MFLFQVDIIQAIGIPFCHSSITISVYNKNCEKQIVSYLDVLWKHCMFEAERTSWQGEGVFLGKGSLFGEWGENTLQGGPKMLSHYIVFHGCPCLNFNHDNFGASFSKVFA
jgi:hypothetical protein